MGRWLTESDVVGARTYKYRGTDKSLLYKYMWSPLAAWAVGKIPKWVSPNLVTFVGFAQYLIAHLGLTLFAPQMLEKVPSWVYAWQGLALFAYAQCDNMDGKQARRTGTSTALGMLFDHGADSLICMLGVLNTAALFREGDSLLLPIFFFCSTTPFLSATIAEFYTHELYMGYFNGPNEGIFFVVSSWLAAAALGGTFYTLTSAPAWFSLGLLPPAPGNVAMRQVVDRAALAAGTAAPAAVAAVAAHVASRPWVVSRSLWDSASWWRRLLALCCVEGALDQTVDIGFTSLCAHHWLVFPLSGCALGTLVLDLRRAISVSRSAKPLVHCFLVQWCVTLTSLGGWALLGRRAGIVCSGLAFAQSMAMVQLSHVCQRERLRARDLCGPFVLPTAAIIVALAFHNFNVAVACDAGASMHFHVAVLPDLLDFVRPVLALAGLEPERLYFGSAIALVSFAVWARAAVSLLRELAAALGVPVFRSWGPFATRPGAPRAIIGAETSKDQ